jgi:hypothetical protein
MPSPRALALSLLTTLTIGGISFADGQLPPPPPPPAAPRDPNAVPPVVAPAPKPPIPADAPRAVLDRNTHDFGTAKQNAELKASFTLKNEGKSTLTVELRADCGCAAAIADVKSLEPGESTPIRMTFRTQHYVGTVTKRVRVLTNDPVDPTLEIKVKVDVAEGVVVDPAYFYFGYVEAGTAPSLTIKVQWKDGVGAPFDLVSSEAPGLDVDVATKKFDAVPWHGYEVTATFRKPPPIGRVTGSVVLRTSAADSPRIVVTLTADVSGKIWVDRREVSLGFLPQGKERTIMVGCHALKTGADLGTVTAKARNGRVVVRAVRAQDKEWLIEIQSPETAAAGRLEDVVEVTSSLVPETAEIVVKGEILPKKD